MSWLPEKPGRAEKAWVLALLALALALRVGFVLLQQPGFYFEDSLDYDRAARAFLQTGHFDARYYRFTDAGSLNDGFGDIVGGMGAFPILGNPYYHQPTDRIETEDLERALVAHRSGVEVLLAPPRLEQAETVSPRDLEKAIAGLAATFDAVVVDLGDGVATQACFARLGRVYALFNLAGGFDMMTSQPTPAWMVLPCLNWMPRCACVKRVSRSLWCCWKVFLKWVSWRCSQRTASTPPCTAGTKWRC